MPKPPPPPLCCLPALALRPPWEVWKHWLKLPLLQHLWPPPWRHQARREPVRTALASPRGELRSKPRSSTSQPPAPDIGGPSLRCATSSLVGRTRALHLLPRRCAVVAPAPRFWSPRQRGPSRQLSSRSPTACTPRQAWPRARVSQPVLAQACRSGPEAVGSLPTSPRRVPSPARRPRPPQPSRARAHSLSSAAPGAQHAPQRGQRAAHPSPLHARARRPVALSPA
mmetsp:Transcript_23333/g.71479  ORF Transcript_23333/g.71479 Transcript_23333/m.71479 type:complete len:226 (-) Transcript_23333:359-1036(-)